MATSITKLLDLGSPSLGLPNSPIVFGISPVPSKLAKELVDLLTMKNGFFAFESALHFRTAQSSNHEIGLSEWNSPHLWITDYQGMADGGYYFAEDIFGGQFCVRHDGIYSFDPESGNREFLTTNLEEWAGLILKDYLVLTGFPLAHEWQLRNGQIPPGFRLVPKIPFIAGGNFSIDNLYALESVQSMKLRASIAVQIRDVPDGSPIEIKTSD